MVVTWFYGRGADITGPVSGPELAALAGSGRLLPTDTVWQDGTEMGVPAARVRHLFPAAAAAAAEPPTVSEPAPESPVPAAVAVAVADAPAYGQMAGTRAVKPGRAVAGKGVVIIGQDGKTVKFRMKCAVCGRDDSSWKSIPIPHGTARTGFFCSKCRKRRDGEVHGYH